MEQVGGSRREWQADQLPRCHAPLVPGAAGAEVAAAKYDGKDNEDNDNDGDGHANRTGGLRRRSRGRASGAIINERTE